MHTAFNISGRARILQVAADGSVVHILQANGGLASFGADITGEGGVASGRAQVLQETAEGLTQMSQRGATSGQAQISQVAAEWRLVARGEMRPFPRDT